MDDDLVYVQVPEPWELQHDEPDGAWQKFVNYRDQLVNGRYRRSLRETAAAFDTDLSAVHRLSKKYHWAARVAAYDRHLDSIKRAKLGEAIERIAERQSKTLEDAGKAVAAPIRAFVKRLEALDADGENPYDVMDFRKLANEVRACARLLPDLITAERLVAGLSTENADVHATVDVRVEDARRWAREQSKDDLERFLVGRVVDGTATEVIDG
jgi:uncharacterized membrane protein YccC